MTRNNWIAVAMVATVAAVGACSPKGGQAGQPDRAVREGNRSATPVSYTIPMGTRITAQTQLKLIDVPVSV